MRNYFWKSLPSGLKMFFFFLSGMISIWLHKVLEEKANYRPLQIAWGISCEGLLTTINSQREIPIALLSSSHTNSLDFWGSRLLIFFMHQDPVKIYTQVFLIHQMPLMCKLLSLCYFLGLPSYLPLISKRSTNSLLTDVTKIQTTTISIYTW